MSDDGFHRCTQHVPLTAADLHKLADELHRLSYTTSAVSGDTRCDYHDERRIEFVTVPGQTDLCALVIGRDPRPTPSASPLPDKQETTTNE